MPSAEPSHGLRRGITFCLLTFALTWPVAWMAALSRLGILHLKVPGGLQMLASLSPGVAAVIMSLRRFGGTGLGRLLKPVIQWRIKPGLYAAVAGISLGGWLLAYELVSRLGKTAWALTTPVDLFMYFLLILPLSALWEEVGWRGFLLPSFVTSVSRLQAALLIGAIWGAWHLPIFLAAHDTLNAGLAEFGVMFVGCIAMSITLTWLYFASRGSLSVCVLFHNGVNAGGYYFFAGLPGSGLVPLAVITAILSIVATVLVPHLTSGLTKEVLPQTAATTRSMI